MRPVRWFVAIVLTVSGCFESVPFIEPEPVSGTRIRNRFYVLDSGERFFVGLWDSELDTRCFLYGAEDGRFACRPRGQFFGEGSFRDPECSEPVLPVLWCPWVGDYATIAFPREPWDACVEPPDAMPDPVRWVTYRVGSVESLSEVYGDFGGCRLTSRGSTSIQELTPVRDVDFVGVEVVLPEDHQSRYGQRQTVTDDGARSPYGLWDRERNETCSVGFFLSSAIPELGIGRAAAAAELPCVPTGSTGPVFVGGAACDEQVALADPCRRVDELAEAWERDACGTVTGVQILAVGPSTTSGPECSPGPSFTIHETAPLSEPFPLFRLELRGTGRLRARVWVGPDGVEQFSPRQGFRDIELGLDCVPLETAGETRCLPSMRFALDGFFADPECSEPVLSLPPGPCDSRHVTLEAATCDEVVRRGFEIGEPVTTTYRLVADVCEPADSGSLGWLQYALDEIPIDRFARIDIVTE